MNTEIDKLISLTYEIEGLLLHLRERGQESMAPHIRNLLADKGRTLAQMLESGEIKPKTAPASEPKEVKAPLPPVPPAVKPTPAPAPAPIVEEVKETATIKEMPTPTEPIAEVKTEIYTESAPTMPEPEVKHEVKEENIPSQTELDEAQAEEDEADSAAAEEAIAQEKHRPEIQASEEAGAKMLKLFTLNDRFRFRRELFGGSDTAMKAILAVIATMPTLDDAKRYLTEDQGMDPESEEVSYFFEIIAPYYTNGR